MKVLSGKNVCKILSQHGFMNVRQRGSHIIIQKKTASSTITVPDHKELKTGTLRSIIRQWGILKAEFE